MTRTIGLFAALLTIALPATAQTPPPPPPTDAKASAAAYVDAAGKSDLYEITASEVVRARTRNPAVRRYADMMIQHHRKTTAATVAAAKRAGMTPPPPMLDPAATASIAELRSADAASVDRMYIGQQVPAHQAALDLHQGYAASGDQPVLRTTARAAVPIVRGHLATAQKLQGNLPAM